MDHANDCTICYEPFDDIETNGGSERVEVHGCHHAFCRECLVEHCKYAISVREVPISCPAACGSRKCDNIIQEDQVRILLCNDNSTTVYGSIDTPGENMPSDQKDDCHDGSYWIQFQRLLQKFKDPTLVSCTKCNELCSRESPCPRIGPIGRSHPNDVKCPSCEHLFCAEHGDGHGAISCNEYTPTRLDARTERMISRYTKPCSHCGIAIHKESGCDHIVCSSCKKDMCFKCGSHQFLSGEMMRSCSKCQQSYIDHRYVWRYRLALCVTLPFFLPFVLIHIVLASVTTVLTCGCFCCLGCGKMVVKMRDDEPSTDEEDDNLYPLLGIRTVLAIIFLPALDLTSQCGFNCLCCGLDDIPVLEGITTVTTSGEDDDSRDEDTEALNETAQSPPTE